MTVKHKHTFSTKYIWCKIKSVFLTFIYLGAGLSPSLSTNNDHGYTILLTVFVLYLLTVEKIQLFYQEDVQWFFFFRMAAGHEGTHLLVLAYVYACVCVFVQLIYDTTWHDISVYTVLSLSTVSMTSLVKQDCGT